MAIDRSLVASRPAGRGGLARKTAAVTNRRPQAAQLHLGVNRLTALLQLLGDLNVERLRNRVVRHSDNS